MLYLQKRRLRSDNTLMSRQEEVEQGVGRGAAVGLGSQRVLVVMYHYVHDRDALVRPDSPGSYRGVVGPSAGEFAAQLDDLCRTHEPIDWPNLYAWMNGRGSIPQRSFLLTFDDGLTDHAETVLPILEDRKLRGVFFVPGSVLTEQRLLCAHATHILLSRMDAQTLLLNLRDQLAKLDADPETIALFDPDAAQNCEAAKLYHYESPVRAYLKYLLTIKLPISLRDRALEQVFRTAVGSPARWGRHWYLGWDDLIKMQAAGHTIGGHGFSHNSYARLSPGAVRRDILRSAATLSDGLGPDRRPFSFPYGGIPESGAEALAEAGFVHAFTTESALVRSDCDPMRIPRFDTIRVGVALGQETMGCARG